MFHVLYNWKYYSAFHRCSDFLPSASCQNARKHWRCFSFAWAGCHGYRCGGVVCCCESAGLCCQEQQVHPEGHGENQWLSGTSTNLYNSYHRLSYTCTWRQKTMLFLMCTQELSDTGKEKMKFHLITVWMFNNHIIIVSVRPFFPLL